MPNGTSLTLGFPLAPPSLPGNGTPQGSASNLLNQVVPPSVPSLPGSGTPQGQQGPQGVAGPTIQLALTQPQDSPAPQGPQGVLTNTKAGTPTNGTGGPVVSQNQEVTSPTMGPGDAPLSLARYILTKAGTPANPNTTQGWIEINSLSWPQGQDHTAPPAPQQLDVLAPGTPTRTKGMPVPSTSTTSKAATPTNGYQVSTLQLGMPDSTKPGLTTTKAGSSLSNTTGIQGQQGSGNGSGSAQDTVASVVTLFPGSTPLPVLSFLLSVTSLPALEGAPKTNAASPITLDLQVAPSSVDPKLSADAATGAKLPEITLLTRDPAAGGYLQYTLADVAFTNFTTSLSGGTLTDSLSLTAGGMKEAFLPAAGTKATGDTTQQWNQVTNSATDKEATISQGTQSTPQTSWDIATQPKS